MAEAALSDLRVLDLSRGVAGAYCTKLLADLGGTVLKIEPPGGDDVRHLGPFSADRPDPNHGGLHYYLNSGKKSCVMDLEEETARRTLSALIARADVLVEDLRSAQRMAWGLGPEETLRRNESLVHLSITPFGLT